MATSTTITLRIPSRLKKRLDNVAKEWGRSKSEVGAEALEDFVEWNEHAIERIKAGIAAAERGDFASDEDVKATFSRLKKKYRAD